MKLFAYKFSGSIPVGIDPAHFGGQVARAFLYVEKASGGKVKFSKLGSIDAKEASRWGVTRINIGFDEMIVPGRYAETTVINGIRSIAFNRDVKWQTKWWHKILTHRPDLYAYAVHEIGHILGLGHNLDPAMESAMTNGPAFGEFSPREIEHLKNLV